MLTWLTASFPYWTLRGSNLTTSNYWLCIWKALFWTYANYIASFEYLFRLVSLVCFISLSLLVQQSKNPPGLLCEKFLEFIKYDHCWRSSAFLASSKAPTPNTLTIIFHGFTEVTQAVGVITFWNILSNSHFIKLVCVRLRSWKKNVNNDRIFFWWTTLMHS